MEKVPPSRRHNVVASSTTHTRSLVMVEHDDDDGDHAHHPFQQPGVISPPPSPQEVGPSIMAGVSRKRQRPISTLNSDATTPATAVAAVDDGSDCESRKRALLGTEFDSKSNSEPLDATSSSNSHQLEITAVGNVSRLFAEFQQLSIGSNGIVHSTSCRKCMHVHDGFEIKCQLPDTLGISNQLLIAGTLDSLHQYHIPVFGPPPMPVVVADSTKHWSIADKPLGNARDTTDEWHRMIVLLFGRLRMHTNCSAIPLWIDAFDLFHCSVAALRADFTATTPLSSVKTQAHLEHCVSFTSFCRQRISHSSASTTANRQLEQFIVSKFINVLSCLDASMHWRTRSSSTRLPAYWHVWCATHSLILEAADSFSLPLPATYLANVVKSLLSLSWFAPQWMCWHNVQLSSYKSWPITLVLLRQCVASSISIWRLLLSIFTSLLQQRSSSSTSTSNSNSSAWLQTWANDDTGASSVSQISDFATDPIVAACSIRERLLCMWRFIIRHITPLFILIRCHASAISPPPPPLQDLSTLWDICMLISSHTGSISDGPYRRRALNAIVWVAHVLPMHHTSNASSSIRKLWQLHWFDVYSTDAKHTDAVIDEELANFSILLPAWCMAPEKTTVDAFAKQAFETSIFSVAPLTHSKGQHHRACLQPLSLLLWYHTRFLNSSLTTLCIRSPLLPQAATAQTSATQRFVTRFLRILPTAIRAPCAPAATALEQRFMFRNIELLRGALSVHLCTLPVLPDRLLKTAHVLISGVLDVQDDTSPSAIALVAQSLILVCRLHHDMKSNLTASVVSSIVPLFNRLTELYQHATAFHTGSAPLSDSIHDRMNRWVDEVKQLSSSAAPVHDGQLAYAFNNMLSRNALHKYLTALLTSVCTLQSTQRTWASHDQYHLLELVPLQLLDLNIPVLNSLRHTCISTLAASLPHFSLDKIVKPSLPVELDIATDGADEFEVMDSLVELHTLTQKWTISRDTLIAHSLHTGIVYGTRIIPVLYGAVSQCISNTSNSSSPSAADASWPQCYRMDHSLVEGYTQLMADMLPLALEACNPFSYSYYSSLSPTLTAASSISSSTTAPLPFSWTFRSIVQHFGAESEWFRKPKSRQVPVQLFARLLTRSFVRSSREMLETICSPIHLHEQTDRKMSDLNIIAPVAKNDIRPRLTAVLTEFRTAIPDAMGSLLSLWLVSMLDYRDNWSAQKKLTDGMQRCVPWFISPVNLRSCDLFECRTTVIRSQLETLAAIWDLTEMQLKQASMSHHLHAAREKFHRIVSPVHRFLNQCTHELCSSGRTVQAATCTSFAYEAAAIVLERCASFVYDRSMKTPLMQSILDKFYFDISTLTKLPPGAQLAPVRTLPSVFACLNKLDSTRDPFLIKCISLIFERFFNADALWASARSSAKHAIQESFVHALANGVSASLREFVMAHLVSFYIKRTHEYASYPPVHRGASLSVSLSHSALQLCGRVGVLVPINNGLLSVAASIAHACSAAIVNPRIASDPAFASQARQASQNLLVDPRASGLRKQLCHLIGRNAQVFALRVKCDVLAMQSELLKSRLQAGLYRAAVADWPDVLLSFLADVFKLDMVYLATLCSLAVPAVSACRSWNEMAECILHSVRKKHNILLSEHKTRFPSIVSLERMVPSAIERIHAHGDENTHTLDTNKFVATLLTWLEHWHQLYHVRSTAPPHWLTDLTCILHQVIKQTVEEWHSVACEKYERVIADAKQPLTPSPPILMLSGPSASSGVPSRAPAGSQSQPTTASARSLAQQEVQKIIVSAYNKLCTHHRSPSALDTVLPCLDTRLVMLCLWNRLCTRLPCVFGSSMHIELGTQLASARSRRGHGTSSAPSLLCQASSTVL
jgi:hypothetical protein